MASAAEREALGLPSDASAEAVLDKIRELSQQAEEAKTNDSSDIVELEAELANALIERDEFATENNELKKQLEEAQSQVVPGVSVPDANKKVKEGYARTENGIEELVEKRVKLLSITWNTFEESHTKQGEFVQKEHRATRGDVIGIPKSYAKRYSEPDIDAFFDTVDKPSSSGENGEQSFSQMSESDLINWHRLNKPSAKDVIDAAAGDPDVARRLVEAENAATGGDPREEVIHGLTEIIARDN